MKDKIFEVAKNHTENEETAMQLTNELCVLLGVSKCDHPRSKTIEEQRQEQRQELLGSTWYCTKE